MITGKAKMKIVLIKLKFRRVPTGYRWKETLAV